MVASSVKLIPLTQGFSTKVDDADYEWLSQWKWYAAVLRDGQPRAVRHERADAPLIYMHRVILGITDPKTFVDHKSGDTLDNQRSNLRESDAKTNGENRRLNSNSTTGVRGVYQMPSGRYRAYGYHNYVKYSLGVYGTLDEAAAAAKTWRAKHHTYGDGR